MLARGRSLSSRDGWRPVTGTVPDHGDGNGAGGLGYVADDPLVAHPDPQPEPVSLNDLTPCRSGVRSEARMLGHLVVADLRLRIRMDWPDVSHWTTGQMAAGRPWRNCLGRAFGLRYEEVSRSTGRLRR